MTNSPKQNVFNPDRILTVCMGFVLFAIVCLSLSQDVFAETVPVNGMNDSTNYTDVDIVDTLGKAAYTHKGTITGASSLTVNAPATNSNYRQWLGGSNGSYTFTGPITVNGGQLLINTGKLSTKTINLNGGDMYVMYEDCLPHDAVVNISEGSMLDVESATNAIIGATINVSSGGTFRQAERNVNNTTDLVTLNIAGTGTSTYRGAIHVRGGTTDLQLTANINLTNNAELFLTNMNTGKQFLVRGKLTGSSTLTLASDNAERWIRLYEGTNTATSINAMDLSNFSGNFVVDKVKARFYTSSLGTGSNITVKNSGTAIFNNTTALNNYNGSFTVNNATISLEAAGKLNNLSGDANGIVSFGSIALTLNNTSNTTFNGTLSGTGAITKNGSGGLTLTKNLSGAKITSKAGTLVLGTAGNEMNIGSSSVIKTDSGAVRVDGNVVVNTSYFSASGTWTGNGSIKVSSGGVLRTGGTFGFAKGITLNGGLLFNDGDNYSSAKVTITSPITITEAGGSVQCGWSSNKSGEIHLEGGLNGSGALTVNKDSNMGWIYMTGSGNYTGTLILKGKIVTGPTGKGSEANPASTTPYLGSGEIRLDGGLLLNNSSYWDVPNKINVVSNSSIRAGYSRPFTFSGAITGSGMLTVENDNSWIVMKTSSPDNSFTGNVQINHSSSSSQGRVKLAADQPFGANVGQGNIYGTLNMNGYSQKFNGLFSDGSKGNIYNDASALSTLTLDTTGKNLTYSGVISQNIALEIIGTGTQTFSNGGSSFTGNAAINGGKIILTGKGGSSNSGLGKVQSGRTIYINDGAELQLANQDVFTNAHNSNPLQFTVDGGKLSNSGANYNYITNLTLKDGANLYAADGNATWKAYKLHNLKVERNSDDASGATVTITAASNKANATIAFGDVSDVISAGNSVSTVNVADITSPDSAIIDDVSDLVISAVIADPTYQTDGALKHSTQIIKTGAGTMELTAANTYTGMVTINEGTLKLSGDAIKTNGPITVGTDGTLEYNLSSGQTKKLTITNASKIFSTGKVVKTGDGTLQIYTAAAGQVDASSFIVSSGRLDMKEYFKGSLAVESGATMSPGNSVGTLTVDGTYNLDSGATLLLEVGKDGQGNIVIDQLFVNGNATFEPGSIIDIVLDPSSSLKGGDTFSSVIITANNAESIFDEVQKAIRSYYFTDLSVTRSGNQISLSGRLDPNAVPEPSTWALLVLGVAGLLYWRKRKIERR